MLRACIKTYRSGAHRGCRDRRVEQRKTRTGLCETNCCSYAVKSYTDVKKMTQRLQINLEDRNLKIKKEAFTNTFNNKFQYILYNNNIVVTLTS